MLAAAVAAAVAVTYAVLLATPAAAAGPRLYTFEVVRELPHDPRAFTQGLQFDVHEGREVFWESTGIYGQSQLREVRSRAWF